MIEIKKVENTRKCSVCLSENNIYAVKFRNNATNSGTEVTLCEKCLTELSEQLGQKKGQWIPQKGGGYCCSECGNYVLAKVEGNFIHVSAKTDYCPYCGSRMKGEK